MAYSVLHTNGKTYEFPDAAKAQQFLSLYPDAELLNAEQEEQPQQNQTEDVFDNLILAESSGRQFDTQGRTLESNKGALGVAQVLPSTAVDPGYNIPSIFNLADQLNVPYQNRDEESASALLGNETVNRAFGESYYSAMLDRYNGDQERALVAYNYGPDNADSWDGSRDSLPKETKDYVTKILGPETQTVAPEVFSVLHSNGKTYEFPNKDKAQQFLSLYPEAELLSSDEEAKTLVQTATEETGDDDVGFVDSFQKGMKRVMTTWYTLADMFQDSEESEAKLKEAQEEYDAIASDPRIAEAIRKANDASAAEDGSFTAAAMEMLDFFLRNPGAALNFFGEQLPGVIASLPFGGVAGLATKGVAAKFLSSRAANMSGTAVGGSTLNSTAVVASALGPNYKEGLDKFNGDVEKAREYAKTKTIAEVKPNAIAGAFIGFAPFSKFIKSPTFAATGNVATQFGIQGTGGALGAKAAAESVGEKAEMGELALEALGEGFTAPIDIVASRAAIARKQKADEIITDVTRGMEPSLLQGVDTDKLQNAVENAVGKGTSRADIDTLIYEYIIATANGVQNDATAQVDGDAQENVEQTTEAAKEDAKLQEAQGNATPTVIPQAVKDMQDRLDIAEGRKPRNRTKGAPEGLINPNDLSADEQIKLRQRQNDDMQSGRSVDGTSTADKNVKDIQRELDIADGVPSPDAQLELDLNRPDLTPQQKQKRIVWLDDTETESAANVDVDEDAALRQQELDLEASEFDDPVGSSVAEPKPKVKPKGRKKKKGVLELTTVDEEIIIEEAENKLKNTKIPAPEQVKKYKNKKRVPGLGDVAVGLGKLDAEETKKVFNRRVAEELASDADTIINEFDDPVVPTETPAEKIQKNLEAIKLPPETNAAFDEISKRLETRVEAGDFGREPTAEEKRAEKAAAKPQKATYTIEEKIAGAPDMFRITDDRTGVVIDVANIGTPVGEPNLTTYAIVGGSAGGSQNVVGTTKKQAIENVQKILKVVNERIDRSYATTYEVFEGEKQFRERVIDTAKSIYGDYNIDAKGKRVPQNTIPRGENRANYAKVKKQLTEAIANTKPDTASHRSLKVLAWVLERNPSLATNINLKINKGVRRDGVLASYTFENRLIDLFGRAANNQSDADVGAAVHELLHHTERYLPTDIREAISKEWEKDIKTNLATIIKAENEIMASYTKDYKAGVYTKTNLNKAIDTDDTLTLLKARRHFFELLPIAYAGDLRARLAVADVVERSAKGLEVSPKGLAQVLKSIKQNPDFMKTKDTKQFTDTINATAKLIKNSHRNKVKALLTADESLSFSKMYSLTDPSEWWAMNGSELLVKASESKNQPAWIGQVKKWLSTFVDFIVSLLGPGYNRNNGLVRGIEYIIGEKDLVETTNLGLSGQKAQREMGSLDLNNVAIDLDRVRDEINGSYTSKALTESYQAAITADNNIGKDGVKFAGKNLTKVLSDPTLAASLLASDTFSILEVLRKSDIKSLNNLADKLDKEIDGLGMERQEILQIGKKTYDQLSEFILGSPVGGRLLQEIMTDSTVMRFDPSEFTSITEAIQKDKALVALREKLKEPNISDADKTKVQQTIDGRTKDMRSVYSRWELLGKMKRNKKATGVSDTKVEAEGHKLYKEVRDVYAEMFKRNEEIQLANIDKLGLSEVESLSVKETVSEMYSAIRDQGVYFPLLRFGDYWIKVKTGPNTGLWTFEKESERDAFMAQVEKDLGLQGQEVGEETLVFGNNRKELRNTYENTDNLLGAIYDNLNKLSFKKAGTGDTLGIVEEIKDQILNVYLTTLPDRDLRTRLAKRKATPGYSYDQARAFSFYMGAASAQLPRLRRKKDAELALSQARDSVKNQPYQVRVNKIIDELAQRTRAEFSPEPQSELLRKIENISGQSIFYTSLLGVDTALQNYNVIATFAPAVLGQKYGIGAVKTLGTYLAFGKGAQQIASGSINEVNINETALDTEVGSLGNLARVKKNPFLKAAYEYANNRGLFGTNYLEQFMSAGYTPTEGSIGEPVSPIKNGMRRLGRLISFPFRYSERHVREIVYFSAVEEEFKSRTKALKKAGKSTSLNEEQVIEIFEEAKRLTKEIAFDYSRFNRSFNKFTTASGVGGFLARNASRLQSFRLQAIAFVVRNFAMSLGAIKHLPASERKAAFSKLMTFSVMTALTAGTTGVMGYTLVTSIINGILNELDEDDPTNKTLTKEYRDDFTLWMKESWLPENVANDKLRLMLTNGVIDTATGYNFSAMLNMDSMIAPSLYGSPSASLDMRARFSSAADTFLGVGYDRLLDFADTTEKVSSQLVRGNFDKALSVLGESLRNTLPNIKDVSEAYRLASVGEIDKDTKAIIRFEEDIPTSEVLMRVIGREPLEISERKDAELRRTRVYGEARAMRTKLRRLLKDNLRDMLRRNVARIDTPIDTILGERERILQEIYAFNRDNPTAEIDLGDTFQKIDQELTNEVNNPKRYSGISKEEAALIKQRSAQ